MPKSTGASYYADKIESLGDIFGVNEVHLESDGIRVGGKFFPIIDDVIILLESARWPSSVRAKLGFNLQQAHEESFAEDIQYTFGAEWTHFDRILAEHEREFRQYFDLIDLTSMKDSRICDLGCGMGRWSYFLFRECREVVLMDFSEAIFSARENLRDAQNALFFMGDLQHLPFRDDFADLIVCLGVLHHLPTNALNEVRALGKYSPRLLIYLYYALENRPAHFRLFLAGVTFMRKILSRIRNHQARMLITWLVAVSAYLPLLGVGRLMGGSNLRRYVPLCETYQGKGLHRIRQDVYDRVFTRIEQRFNREEIGELRKQFSEVLISDDLPYWHFLCRR